MKHAVATALLVLALAAGTPASAADTIVRECSGCDAPMRNYGSAKVVQIKPDADRPDVPDADRSYQPVPEPSYQSAPEPSYQPAPERSYRPISQRSTKECDNCGAPRKKYHSVEVIKSHRNIDRSRVIHTRTVVPVYRRARPVVRVPVVTVVQYVVHQYRVVDTPIVYTYRLPVYRPAHPVYRGVHPIHDRVHQCRRGPHGYYSGSCSRVLRVGG